MCCEHELNNMSNRHGNEPGQLPRWPAGGVTAGQHFVFGHFSSGHLRYVAHPECASYANKRHLYSLYLRQRGNVTYIVIM